MTYKSANMATTKLATFIFICLLGTSMITLSAGSSSDFSYSRVFYITPNKTAATTLDPLQPDEQLGSAMGGIVPSGTTTYTLQEVLQNYKQFFTSNTKLKLLPGMHEVTESFDGILVQRIHDFAIVGTSCNSDDTSEKCSKVECLGNASLGFAFMNLTNVRIANFHFSKCAATTVQANINWKHLLYSFAFYSNLEMMLFFDNEDTCETYMFLATDSWNVTVENMIFSHSTTGACLAAVGVTILHVQHSMFLDTNCFIRTLDNLHHSVAFDIIDQFYMLSDLSFIASDNNFSGNAYGLLIEFQHVLDSVVVFLERVHFQHKSLKIGYYTVGVCGDPFDTTYTVAVMVNNLTLIGKQESCNVLKITKEGLNTACFKKINVKVILEYSHFVRSSIEIRDMCSTLINRKNIKLEIEQVSIEQVPCDCDFALSAYCATLNFKYFTVTQSCCKYSLVSFVDTIVIFNSQTTFTKNNGTCLSVNDNSIVTFSGKTTFSDNIAETNSGSTVITINSLLDVSFGSKNRLLFRNNTGASCGGIMAKKDSEILVRSLVQFVNNKGYDGGALALYEHSILQYGSAKKGSESGESVYTAKVQFIGNSAQRSGGAVFIADEGYETRHGNSAEKSVSCAFMLRGPFIDVERMIRMTAFINNTASYSGSAIFGGWIDICNYELCPLRKPKLIANPEDPSVISSNPLRVCICIDSSPQCDNIEHQITNPLYPGQSFQIKVVAIGQRLGTTPAIVLATFANTSIKVDKLQKVQSVDKFCTSLNYTVKSPNENETLQLDVDTTSNKIDKPASLFISKQAEEQVELLFKQMKVIIPLLPCPLGYDFDRNTSSCVCKRELVKHGIECNTTTYTILRISRQWINATFTHILNETNHGVLVHNHCPLDYCLNEDQFLNLEKPSNQCNFERSGILCGSCQQNLSHIFGSNKCKKCSSLWAILVIPVFILLGLGLVTLIILLNLTVAEGTVNALIFYVNIVSANQATFFPIETTNTFFRWFIAWLNLDIGVETCFISGLGAYTKTWLQFLFPFYIWFLVIVIIMASRRSTLAARLSGENAVQALGTLFLLSYTKLLRITITTFSSAQLVYPDGFTRRVWLYDGNVEFLEAKHAVLFVAALLLLVLISAPYTLVLLTIQWLQRLPYHFLLAWVWKLKPLFDAHTGPHKEKHRYWPGLLLLIRAILFVAFSLNFRNDPALNLLITSITSFCLLTYLAYLGGVYQTIYLDILEYVFLLNLGILSAATFYTRLTEGDQDKVIKTSVSIALFVSLVIVLSHVYLKVKSTRHGSHFLHFLSETFKKACSPLTHALNRFGIVKTITRNNPFINNTGTAARAKKTHTHSTIELKEPLLVEAKMA